MANDITLNGYVIAPGERATLDLPLPDLYTHARLQMPVQVLRGKRDGPCLLVCAALHGDEINGVEIIRRVLAMPLLKRLRGALIAVPVVNVFGFIGHSRYLPDRRDLNRTFPGSESGSLAARIAHTFLTGVVQHADVVIDLHTGALHRTNLPQIRAHLEDSETRRLAEAFAAPVILDSGSPEGSLRAVAGRPLLLYEGGEALRFDELAIRAGVRGIVGVMRALRMLPAAKERGLKSPVIARRSRWLRAPQSGILRATKRLGAHVSEEQILAYISDPFGERETVVRAHCNGIVIGRIQLPLVNEGEALFHIAHLSHPDEVAETVERYHEELTEMVELADPDFAQD